MVARGFGPGYRHCSSDALLQNPSSSKIQNIKIAKDPQITALELLHEIRSPSSVIISSSHSYAKYIASHPDVPSDALRPKCVLSWSTLSPPRLATDHYGERSIEHYRRRCCCGGRRAKFTEHGPSLERLVIFLLPCANMSLLRRQLLQPAIPYKGGVVTTDPMAATHCVVAIPFESDIACVLLRKYGGSPSCRLVPDSFLYQ